MRNESSGEGFDADALNTLGLRFEPTPVTVGDYRKFCADTGKPMPPLPSGQDRDTQPMTCVSFLDAEDYTKWLCRKTGRRLRIATEAEIVSLERLVAPDPGHVWPLPALPDVGTTPAANTLQDPPIYDALGVVLYWCADPEDREVMVEVWNEVSAKQS